MWAGLLIPMWLRRHEQETEVRSVDRFSTAMRILSRRPTPPPDRRYLVMPQRPPAATQPVADVPRAAAPRRAPQAKPARPAARRSGRARLVARRRRLTLGLFGLTFFTFVLALAGVLSWWWQVVFDLALVAYVVHLRAEARRAREFRRLHGHARPVVRERVAAPPEPAPVEAVDVPVRRQAAPLQEEYAAPVAGPLVIDEDTWEPVPVPLPTYVTAP